MTIVIDFEKLKILVDEIVRLNILGRSKQFGVDHIKYLEVSILEGELFDGNNIPSTLEFSILDGQGGVTEFNNLEEIEPINYFYRL